MIKVWVNIFKLFFSDKVMIFVFVLFFLFNLGIFNLLFLYINKVGIFMGIFSMVNMVIRVIKAELVQFWTRASNCSLRRTYIFVCIFVFIKVLWLGSMFLIVLRELFSG